MADEDLGFIPDQHDDGLGFVPDENPYKQVGMSALSAARDTLTAPWDFTKGLATTQPEEVYKKAGPWLPAAGAAIGTAVIPVPGFGTAVGAGAGEMLRQAGGIGYNDPAVMKMVTPGRNFSSQAGLSAAGQTLMAGADQVNGLVKAAPGARPYVERGINYAANKLAPLGKKIVDFGAGVAQAASGKPAAKFKMLFKDPSAILPESLGGSQSLEKAGKGMEAAFGQTGIKKKTFNPFENDEEAQTIGKETFNKWQSMKSGGMPPSTAGLPEVDLAAAKMSEEPVAVFIGQDNFGPNGSPRKLYDVYQKGQELGARPTLPEDALPDGVKIIGKAPGVKTPEDVINQYGKTMYGAEPPAPNTNGISAQEAYNAKRATDYMFPKVISERNKEKIAQLTEFKHGMDDILSKQAGPLQKASANYGRARLGQDMSQILPRTKTGDVSTVKTVIPFLFNGLMDAKRAALLPLTSPIVWGTATAAAATASQVAGWAATNPTARQALISRYIVSREDKTKP